MRNSQSRRIDPAKKLHRLERKHATLKDRVAELSDRSFLTAAEELEMQKLKKKKLATKDELETVRQEVGTSP
jgi:hypothetical protein